MRSSVPAASRRVSRMPFAPELDRRHLEARDADLGEGVGLLDLVLGRVEREPNAVGLLLELLVEHDEARPVPFALAGVGSEFRHVSLARAPDRRARAPRP